MKKIIKHIFVFVCLMAILALPLIVSASNGNLPSDYLNKAASGGPGAPYENMALGSNDLASIVGTVIQAFLGLLGVIFLVYMLYAGYNWMIAQGEEEKVEKAKDTIKRAVIGLIIVIGAYAISLWVFDRLLNNTGIYSSNFPAN